MSIIVPGPSGAIAAVTNTLKAHLSAQIDRVWSEILAAEPADTVVKLYPKLIVPHYRTRISEHSFVMVYSTGGASHGTNSGGYGEMEHRGLVEWWLTSDKEDVAQELSARWALAIWRTLGQNSQLDGTLNAPSMDAPAGYTLAVGQPAEGKGIVCRGRIPWTVVVEESL